MLGFGVIWWSIATALTPLAASLGLPALLFARACMGVGEGVAMPAMNNLLSRCFPYCWPQYSALSNCAAVLYFAGSGPTQESTAEPSIGFF